MRLLAWREETLPFIGNGLLLIKLGSSSTVGFYLVLLISPSSIYFATLCSSYFTIILLPPILLNLLCLRFNNPANISSFSFCLSLTKA